MDYYMESVAASVSADRALRWTQPVKIFGYIVIVAGVLVAVVGVISGLATLGGRQGQAGLATMMGALVAGAVIFLQGSFVLMITHYVEMRARYLNARVSRALEPDEDGDGGDAG